MSDSPSWLNVSEIDLEEDYRPKAVEFLEKEIETEYVKNRVIKV